jgi:hypothetical protein
MICYLGMTYPIYECCNLGVQARDITVQLRVLTLKLSDLLALHWCGGATGRRCCVGGWPE